MPESQLSNPAPDTAPVVSGPPPQPKPERLMSLDAFRGLTIAGMILVNNPGSWDTIYWPLEHAPWDGWTPTDFVFPFFLFMVGTAMTFSFDKRLKLAGSGTATSLLSHAFARAAVLILLGLTLTGFPNFRLITPFILSIAGIQLLFNDKPGEHRRRTTPLGWMLFGLGLVWWVVDFRYFNGPAPRGSFSDFFPLGPGGKTPIRIPGVLQRIGLCFAAASVIMVLFPRAWSRLAWAIGLIALYWVMMKYLQAPAGYIIGNGVEGAKPDAPAGVPFPGTFNDWLDVSLLGGHLYRVRPDPEGLLSTIPAIATTLLGALAGMWLQNPSTRRESKGGHMFIAGLVLIGVGEIMGIYFPINKKIWTSSYVVAMAGWSLVFFAACYHLIDVRGWKRWSLPFVVLGTNSILAFFGSGLMAKAMGMIKWGPTDNQVSLHSFLYSFYKSGISNPKNASLAWAICFVTLWVLLITPLYRKKIFLKV
ncbi:MAG: heparan-alpha-glucosaminide N-acetyltransferase domain-containing protein [Candidatus Sumerlaeaceae bacterium]|nr:heparan-alpha-glucosaminide N-acetyltransferase domain-containing protein [Candidatus Sumerlaeaceae bacterium]